MPQGTYDITEIRSRLAASSGPAYWRSLEELADTSEFQEAVQREFPSWASRWENCDALSRRNLLKIMGASLGLMGLNGCFFKRPQGKIVPYPNPPEEIVAGRPTFFATAMPFCGYGKGVLALSTEGRPIKIEGNPDHPASLGGTDVFMQASVLDLYDPDRAREVRLAGQTSRWGDFQEALTQRLEGKRHDGTGVRILTGTVTSPVFLNQMQEFLKRYPAAQWHQFEPSQGDASAHFPEPVETLYDFHPASVVVSFGADFMFRDPLSVRYAREFIDGRRVRKDAQKMNRLYVVESTLTLTGSMADHRVALAPSRIEAVARALAAKVVGSETNRRVGVLAHHRVSVGEYAHPTGAIAFDAGRDSARRDVDGGINPALHGLRDGAALSPELQHWVDILADDLMHPQNAGATLVLAGANQSPAVHALVHLINQKLGNLGKTVFHIDPVAPRPAHSLSDLAADILDNKADTLLMIGVNPAYTAPADVPMAHAIETMSRRGDFTASLSTHYDETAFLCQWHIPRTHYLEAWGDIRAYDGTASIIQPLIAPLFGAHSEWELMDTLLGRRDRQGLEIVRTYWREHSGASDFEKWWLQSLQRGVIENTASPHRDAPALKDDVATSRGTGGPPVSSETENHGRAAHAALEILFEPDASAWDGHFTNNAWLQETPRPFTKLTWDNAIAINLRMAEKLAPVGQKMLREGDVVRLDYQGRAIEAPVILLPGQADDLVTLYLGYGRTRGGHVMLEDSKPRGYNAYALRTSSAPWAGAGAALSLTGKFHLLVMTRNHHAMSIAPGAPGVAPWLKPQVIAKPGLSEMNLEVENRKIVRTATLKQFRDDNDVIKHLDPEEEKKPLLSLYPGWNYEHGLQWGMSIDMTACIGCNACMVACQAENNIAVVGKEEVSRQREMHWIRIDSYFSGDIDAPTIHHQPVPCMHCENAPCEYVCPVGATTHSDEGINEMTYNRCIGTRYCSNNCPYKVRRFNFFLFSDYQSPTLRLQRNPDVTVRSRGVMEKCTYCIHRIDRTRIEMEERVLALQEQGRAASDAGERDRLMQKAKQRGAEIVRQLQTACQQACPTRAIEFGDIRDPGSEVTRLKKEPTDYVLLGSLTTKPRTSYLAHVINPNPALSQEGGA